MKRFLFFLVAIGVILALWYVSSCSHADGFQDTPPPGANPGLNIPLISPREQTLSPGEEVQPFAPPSATLLAPPPGQVASVNTLPFEDPAFSKAPASQIQNLHESLVGFLTNEAEGLKALGDPSVQLPLTTARSDKARLEDELSVLQRNPGLESSLTEEDINGIQANLSYLQKKWRLSANSISGLDGDAVEGYQNMEESPAEFPVQQRNFITLDRIGDISNNIGLYLQGLKNTGNDDPKTKLMIDRLTKASKDTNQYLQDIKDGKKRTGDFKITMEAFQSSGASDITMGDLTDLSTKIGLEIVRLTSSGSTDTATQSRVNVLNKVKNSVDTLMNEIKIGNKKIIDVQLTKTDIASFLPAMSNPSAPLPNIIDALGGSSFLNNLFPVYPTGDASGANISQNLFSTYANNLMNNLSWDVNLSYTGKAEQDAVKNISDMNKRLYPMQYANDQNNIYNSTALIDSSGNRGFFDSIIQQLSNALLGKNGSQTDASGNAISSAAAIGGAEAAAGPFGHGTDVKSVLSGDQGQDQGYTRFDWKTRALHICNQVEARGFDSLEFGCLNNPNEVSQDFSWRGYAKMVCSRIATIYDPSVPEMCGCPPPTWPGWRP
jgi:hypothetical protein